MGGGLGEEEEAMGPDSHKLTLSDQFFLLFHPNRELMLGARGSSPDATLTRLRHAEEDGLPQCPRMGSVSDTGSRGELPLTPARHSKKKERAFQNDTIFTGLQQVMRC